MIAPKELRLGNWVRKEKSDQYYAIEQGQEIDNAAAHFFPIPITPEILQQFGFAFHEYFKLWQKNKSLEGKGPDMELDRDFWVLDFSHHRIGVELHSLHQLQNLYFSLKGKELQVAQ